MNTLRPSRGRLLILLPGLGAIASTTIAGVELVRRGLGVPVGSLTQLGRLELPVAGGVARVPVREALPLAPLDDLAFGAWDIEDRDAARAAERAGVLSPAHQAEIAPALARVRPRPGCHDPERVRRLDVSHTLTPGPHRATIARLRRDIQELRAEAGAARAVMVLTTSTETRHDPSAVTVDVAALEAALDADDPRVSPSMLYAYAALAEGVPFANATPNLCAELPAFQELALARGVPTGGKDLKSGQTFLKTAVAPALRLRHLGLQGWFSTNILGNRDGEVLDDPDAFLSKEATKSGVLGGILDPEEQPALYGDVTHRVAIHYYPPRGDEKEGWDNVDLFGWLGYPMQLKINFLCRDSILAAPLVLDLALLLDVAQRSGAAGIQEWLSFFFKSPAVAPGERQEHDLFVQHAMLERMLVALAASTSTGSAAAEPATAGGVR